MKDYISSKAVVNQSSTQGKGLFAIQDISLGEVVVRWNGANYTNKAGSQEAAKKGKLIMQWDEDLYSFEDRGDDQGYFINHSCDSNLWMKDAYTLIARKKILAGEEITADYALWEHDKSFIATWTCNCHAKDCRTIITGEDWKLPSVQEKYYGHFSPLINKLLQKQNI